MLNQKTQYKISLGTATISTSKLYIQCYRNEAGHLVRDFQDVEDASFLYNYKYRDDIKSW